MYPLKSLPKVTTEVAGEGMAGGLLAIPMLSCLIRRLKSKGLINDNDVQIIKAETSHYLRNLRENSILQQLVDYDLAHLEVLCDEFLAEGSETRR